MHEPHPWLHCRCQKVQLWQLLWAVAAGNVEKRPVIGKQLQILPSFYFPQYSDSPVFTLSVSQPICLTLFFPQVFVSHSAHFFPSSILSVCPIVSFSVVCQWLQASQLAAQTMLVLFLPAYWCFRLNIQWFVCLCIYFSIHHQARHWDKII